MFWSSAGPVKRHCGQFRIPLDGDRDAGYIAASGSQTNTAITRALRLLFCISALSTNLAGARSMHYGKIAGKSNQLYSSYLPGHSIHAASISLPAGPTTTDQAQMPTRRDLACHPATGLQVAPATSSTCALPYLY